MEYDCCSFRSSTKGYRKWRWSYHGTDTLSTIQHTLLHILLERCRDWNIYRVWSGPDVLTGPGTAMPAPNHATTSNWTHSEAAAASWQQEERRPTTPTITMAIPDKWRTLEWSRWPIFGVRMILNRQFYWITSGCPYFQYYGSFHRTTMSQRSK